MNICQQVGSHAGQGKQYDLPHFVLVVARCGRCGEFLETKIVVKGEKKI